jgi:hypothetical protein
MRSMRGHLVLCSLLLLTPACAPQGEPAREPPSREGPPSIPDGPLPEPCSLGASTTEATEIGIPALLVDPTQYYGRLVRVRGYFLLELENDSLLEPQHRQQRVHLMIEKLPVRAVADLKACRHKLVEVEGYLNHVPHRGRQRTIIFAQSMVDARVP